MKFKKWIARIIVFFCAFLPCSNLTANAEELHCEEDPEAIRALSDLQFTLRKEVEFTSEDRDGRTVVDDQITYPRVFDQARKRIKELSNGCRVSYLSPSALPHKFILPVDWKWKMWGKGTSDSLIHCDNWGQRAWNTPFYQSINHRIYDCASGGERMDSVGEHYVIVKCDGITVGNNWNADRPKLRKKLLSEVICVTGAVVRTKKTDRVHAESRQTQPQSPAYHGQLTGDSPDASVYDGR